MTKLTELIDKKIRQLSYPNPGHRGLPGVHGGSRPKDSKIEGSVRGNRANWPKDLTLKGFQERVKTVWDKLVPMRNEKITHIVKTVSGYEEAVLIVNPDPKTLPQDMPHHRTVGVYFNDARINLVSLKNIGTHSHIINAMLQEVLPQITMSQRDQVHNYLIDDSVHYWVFKSQGKTEALRFNTRFATKVVTSKEEEIPALDVIYDTMEHMLADGWPRGIPVHIDGYDANYETTLGNIAKLAELIR